MTILIPAYEPDERLVILTKQIKECSPFDVVVVDDGSGPEYSNIFDKVKALRCTVLTHKTNKGKGRALKTGFEYIQNKTGETEGVVTADADGQHVVPDILAVAEKVAALPESIVLGVRKFSGKVPLRSSLGNKITRFVFLLASGQKVRDTQTGLRGFPISVLPWLVSIEGERFEYEMNMLLMAKPAHITLEQVEIETVYLEENKSSHFRVISDSLLVYVPVFKFCLSSLSGAAVDYIMLFVIQWLTGNLLLAVIGARLLSSAVNFTINRLFVFQHGRSGRKIGIVAVKYYSLVCVILAANYLLLRFFFDVCGIRLFWSKILTEAILFAFSYSMQHLFVFKSSFKYYASRHVLGTQYSSTSIGRHDSAN